jgi:hypothetical protein
MWCARHERLTTFAVNTVAGVAVRWESVVLTQVPGY